MKRMTLLAALAAPTFLPCCAEAPPEFDLILSGGAVVDGTGSPLRHADVGVLDGMVAEVGDLSGRTAVERLDVTGLAVAPGFIDPHVHARGLIREIPTADNFIRQGVTTLVDGNDGSSPLPLGPFLDSVAAVGTALNFALFVGHGTVREAVMGTADRAPTDEELERMKALVAEAIRIGREAGIGVQISHHKVGGKRNYGRSAETLELMRAAHAEGVDVTFDQYPYTASHTSISSIVPAWARAGDPSKIQLSRCGSDAALAGKTLADILSGRGTDPTPDAIADLILELVGKGGCGAIFHSFDEVDVERLLKSEYGMIGSDGGLVRFGETHPHPRAYGTLPRVLGRYVRERRVIGLEEAVRRMTSAPADRLGLPDRGRIEVGEVADLTVFDAGIVVDRATFEDPHQYPVGVRHVFVAGIAVVRDSAVTGARPGQVIRGPGWEGGER